MERFEGWFVAPVEKLKEIPEGDGAFVAMSVALFLCERFYRTKTNTHEGSRGDLAFRQAAAQDMHVADNYFEIFWKVFRHGIQHQGMPKELSLNNPERHYRWELRSDALAVPSFFQVDETHFMITIDPWKFCGFIFDKFRNEPDMLAKAESHAFGSVFGFNENKG